MMPRLVLGLALALSVVVAIAWTRLFGTTAAWATPAVLAISATLAGLAAATVVAAWRRHAGMQIAIACTLLVAQAGIIASRLAGIRVVDYHLFPSKKVAVVIGLALLTAVYGLVRQRVWARWLALALGATGAVSGGINAWHFWSVTRAPDPMHLAWSMEMYLAAWVFWIGALGGAMVVINLASPAVGASIAARTRDATWISPTREARWVRATIITALAAVPMLLVYAWLQPIVPATRDTAVVLAVLLATGATIAIRGKLVGALMLVVAGLGLGAQTAVTALSAGPGQGGTATYYAVFWLPAAVVSIGCGICLAAPVWRLLRRA